MVITLHFSEEDFYSVCTEDCGHCKQKTEGCNTIAGFNVRVRSAFNDVSKEARKRRARDKAKKWHREGETGRKTERIR